MCTGIPSSPSARSRPPARLLRAYRLSRYLAGGAEARLGWRSASVEGLLRSAGVRQGAFIGAANPASRRMADGWNRRRHAMLVLALRRAPVWEGRGEGGGQGRGWDELHVLAGVAPARAVMLARRFRQTAIVVVQGGRPARLRLV